MSQATATRVGHIGESIPVATAMEVYRRSDVAVY
jgi:hypothetical protein